MMRFDDTIMPFDDTMMGFDDTMMRFDATMMRFDATMMRFEDTMMWFADTMMRFDVCVYLSASPSLSPSSPLSKTRSRSLVSSKKKGKLKLGSFKGRVFEFLGQIFLLKLLIN